MLQKHAFFQNSIQIFFSFPETWLFTIFSLPSFHGIFIQLKINITSFLDQTLVKVRNKKNKGKLCCPQKKEEKQSIFYLFWNKIIETFEIASKSAYFFFAQVFFFSRWCPEKGRIYTPDKIMNFLFQCM